MPDIQSRAHIDMNDSLRHGNIDGWGNFFFPTDRPDSPWSFKLYEKKEHCPQHL